jgi:hypothetical protein
LPPRHAAALLPIAMEEPALRISQAYKQTTDW